MYIAKICWAGKRFFLTEGKKTPKKIVVRIDFSQALVKAAEFSHNQTHAILPRDSYLNELSLINSFAASKFDAPENSNFFRLEYCLRDYVFPLLEALIKYCLLFSYRSQMLYDDEHQDRFQEKMIKRISGFPVEIRRRTYAAMGVEQDIHLRKNEQTTAAANLLLSYQNILRELYNQRKEIATGIQGFWVNCLLCNDTCAPMVSNRDRAALEHLTDITIDYIEGDPSKGFTLNFHFEENEHMKKQVLTKTFHQKPINGEPCLEAVRGCDIEWKSETANLTKAFPRESLKHKAKRSTGELTESFFNFFCTPSQEEVDADTDGGEEMQMEYEVGLEIKDNIIPFAVEYFVGDRR